MKTLSELRSVSGKLNSDPNAAEEADELFTKLEKLISTTPALAKSRKLPKADQSFKVPLVSQVIVIALDEREGEAFPLLATQQINLSQEHPNIAVLNFSSQEDCQNSRTE